MGDCSWGGEWDEEKTVNDFQIIFFYFQGESNSSYSTLYSEVEIYDL